MKKYFLQFKWQNAKVFLLAALSSLLFVGAPLILTPLMNSVIALDMKKSLYWMGMFILIWALIIIIGYLEDVEKEKAIQEMSTQLREDLMGNLTGYSYEEFIKEKEGKFASWFNNDVKLIQDNGFRAVFDLYKNVLQVIIASSALFYFHYSLTILAIILTGLLMLVPRLFNKKMAQLTENVKGANEDFLAGTQDILGSFTTFHTHNLQQRLVENIKGLSKQLATENVSFVKGKGRGEMVIEATNLLAQMGTILWTIVLVLEKKVTAGTMFSVGNISSTIFNSLASVFSLVLTIKTIPTVLEKDFHVGSYEAKETASMPSFQNEITLENVSYAYDDKTILEDVSFTFKKNGKYAIAGKSGSGKSTLLNILAKRLTNYQGSIKVDGQELKDIKTSQLQECLEFVEQKPYFFNDTVGNNISLQTPYDLSEMTNILQNLGITNFAKAEDLVTERGRNFSGGQGQRLAIGRGLLFHKDLLFLDEITAGLDEKSSQEIEKLILANPDLTVIMITHHLTEETKGQLDGILEIG